MSRTAVSFGAGNSRFASASAAMRFSDFDQECAVTPDTGETFTQCEVGWSISQKRWWAVTESVAGSDHVATVWRHNGASAFERVLTTSPYGADMSLEGPTWPNHNDVIAADFGGTIEVMIFDSTSGPRVAGVVPLSGGASHLLVAQQVFMWTSGSTRSTTVLDIVPGSPLAGHRTSLSGGARGPEEVALMAYRAWVNRNRSAAAPWVTDEVDKALFEDSPSQGGDLFSLNDTRCQLASGTYTCTFTSTIGTMQWHVRSVDGQLRVVAIDSST